MSHRITEVMDNIRCIDFCGIHIPAIMWVFQTRQGSSTLPSRTKSINKSVVQIAFCAPYCKRHILIRNMIDLLNNPNYTVYLYIGEFIYEQSKL